MAKKKATCTEHMRLNSTSLGIAMGFLGSMMVLAISFMYLMTGSGLAVIALLSSFYIGFDASVAGIVVGTIWGFIDGFLMGYLLAVIYNHFLKHEC